MPLSLLKFPKTVGFMQLLAPGAAQTWSLHSVIKLETEKTTEVSRGFAQLLGERFTRIIKINSLARNVQGL